MSRRKLVVLVALVGCLSAPALVVNAQAPQAPAKQAAAPATVVNLNTATVSQLDTLPGVGAKLAERIIEYRTKNGGFKKIEDLMNVTGIGEKNFLKLKPYITVTPAKSGGNQGDK
jgi:competence protein ComEA